jgi:uncharacterized protein YcgI (DUF1989 family)
LARQYVLPFKQIDKGQCTSGKSFENSRTFKVTNIFTKRAIQNIVIKPGKRARLSLKINPSLIRIVNLLGRNIASLKENYINIGR